VALSEDAGIFRVGFGGMTSNIACFNSCTASFVNEEELQSWFGTFFSIWLFAWWRSRWSTASLSPSRLTVTRVSPSTGPSHVVLLFPHHNKLTSPIFTGLQTAIETQTTGWRNLEVYWILIPGLTLSLAFGCKYGLWFILPAVNCF